MNKSPRFNCQNVVELMGQPLTVAEELDWRTHLESCPECMAKVEAALSSSTILTDLRQLVSDSFDCELEASLGFSSHDFVIDYLEPAYDSANLGSLGNHYDIVEIIGRGGMGVVMKAFDRDLKREVALKALLPHLASDAKSRRRFAKESQSAAAVVHPNVIQIHSVEPSGRLPFLVMSLIEGESLADRLRSRGPLELEEILRVGMQIASGLAAAHEQGLIHRDIKPSNILLARADDCAVLTDFGLARSVDDHSLTHTNGIVGTPEFLSPEAARGERVDRRSDLFSLGCVLYAMAGGRTPFRASTMFGVLRRVTECKPEPLADFRPHLPPWFCAVVHRLLEVDPADRIQTAGELTEILKMGLEHLRAPELISPPAILPSRLSATQPSDASPTGRISHGRRWGIVGSIVGSIVVIAAATLIYLITAKTPWPSHTISPAPGAAHVSEAEAVAEFEAMGATVTHRNNQVVMIEFGGVPVSDEALEKLKYIPTLRGVGLREAEFNPDDLRHIPANIVRVDLGGDVLSLEHCDELSKRKQLKCVGFFGPIISEMGVRTVCRDLPLEQLTLQDVQISDDTLRWLLQFQSLYYLDLNGNTDLTGPALAQLSQFKKLTGLHLGRCRVDDAAVDQIVMSCPLIEVGLTNCLSITDEALHSLAKCMTLETIYLDGCRVSEEGLAPLADLPNLKLLFLRGNFMDKERVQKIVGSQIRIIDQY